MSIQVMQRAARAARAASTSDRLIEIAMGENGPVVRGRANVKGRAVAASLMISWKEFDAYPMSLMNLLASVDRALAKAERQAA